MRRAGHLIALLIAFLVTVGCTSSPTAVAPSTSVTGSPPAALAAELQGILDSMTANGTSPGVVAEVRAPNWTWHGASGTISHNSSIAVTPDVHFRAASVSKFFTAVGILRLVDQGRLSLNDSIASRLSPELGRRIPNGDEITIRQALQHRSGIANDDEDNTVLPAQMAQPNIPVPVLFSIDDALNRSPLYPPDANYTYSDANFHLLSLVIERASGTDFRMFMEREVFAPACLRNTSVPTGPVLPAPRMIEVDNVPDPAVHVNYSYMYMDWDQGAGSIVTTAEDLNRFHRAVREGRVVSPALVSALEDGPLVVEAPEGGWARYGFGYGRQFDPSINVTMAGHTGEYPGSLTFAYYLEEPGIYVAMNANHAGEEVGAGFLSLAGALRSAA
ncbi:MAG: serine hydrolase domain-containing protein [Methanospirillum sp.]